MNCGLIMPPFYQSQPGLGIAASKHLTGSIIREYHICISEVNQKAGIMAGELGICDFEGMA